MFKIFSRKPSEKPPSAAMAVALMQKGDLDGALKEVDALIKLVPDVAMSHRFRGEVLFSMNQFDDSILSFETAERIGGPGTEETFFWRALAHANAGRRSDALSILQAFVDSSGAAPSLIQKCQAAIAAISKAPQDGA